MQHLRTTDQHLADLSSAAEGARDGTATVRVPVPALRAIVRDHVDLLDALRQRKLLRIEVGEDQSSLE